MSTNTRVLLAVRPEGWPTAATFRIEESPLPSMLRGENIGKQLVKVA